jgi:hypothetical protein
VKVGREAEKGKGDGQSPLEKIAESDLALEADRKINGHDGVRF